MYNTYIDNRGVKTDFYVSNPLKLIVLGFKKDRKYFPFYHL